MTTRNLHRHSGMSLIEVLVSMTLLSVALLGTAKLTSASLKSTNTAYYRSQATFLASDILDRMRANATVARAGKYNIDSSGGMSADAGSFAAADCTEWIANVSSALPDGVGTVTVTTGSAATATSTSAATVIITWAGDNFRTVSKL